jgi:hypothetical protein
MDAKADKTSETGFGVLTTDNTDDHGSDFQTADHEFKRVETGVARPA